MGAITQAMARACTDAGVTLHVGTPVTRVVTEKGCAVGTETASGQVTPADVVVSNVHPKILYQRLLSDTVLPEDFRRRIAHYKSESGTFRMNVALSELPRFTCLPETGEHHASGIILAPSIAYMDAAYHSARTDGFSRQPIVEMLIPSTVDDSLAPKGQHVASLFCQHFPYAPTNGQSWDVLRETAADAIIETVNAFAPNFKQSVLGRMALAPTDLERTFGLVGGDIFHGHMSLDQLWTARPMLGHGHYRAPIKGLYMCGSGTHPGGGVSGQPGYNAAREILRDASLRQRMRYALAGQ
jgi:phytoene dehydrogenase-like protein